MRASPSREPRSRFAPLRGAPFAPRLVVPMLLLGVAGCDEALGPHEPGPIVLAASYSQTGRFSQLAGEMALGYRMAVEMLNEQGGIAGREVRLVLVDDGSEAGNAGRIYAGFAATDTIFALLGPYSSPLTEAAVEAADAGGKPLVAPMAADPGIWAGQNRRWSVQMLNPGPTYLQGSVELAVQHGARTAALVYEDTQFPASVADGVREAAADHGLEIVLERTYAAGDADHETLVAAAMDSGADLFIGGGYYADAVELTRAVRSVGYTPLLVSLNLGPALADFVEQLGDGARCVAGNAPWLPTIRTSGHLADSETFVQRYVADRGTMPSYYAAGGFGAVELLAEAITFTTAGGQEPVASAIRDHLFNTKTETVLGPFGVHAPGDPLAGSQSVLKGLQVQWQDDGTGGLTRRIIHPPSVANAEPCFLR